MPIILLLLILAVVGGWLWYKYRTTQKENIVLVEENKELIEEVDELDAEIANLQKEIERKDLELNEKSKLLSDAQTELQKLRSRVQQYEAASKISARKAEEMKRRIDELLQIIETYQAKIEQLEQEKAELTERNQELEKEVAEKKALEEEREHLQAEKMELESKVRSAAQLRAVGFEFAMLRPSGKEKWGEEFSRRLRRLEICFTVLQNKVATPGNRMAYIVLMDPDGKVMPSREGVSTTRAGDEEIKYSMKVSYDYQREDKKVCAIYEKGEEIELSSGRYKVLVYSEDGAMGSGAFHIR